MAFLAFRRSIFAAEFERGFSCQNPKKHAVSCWFLAHAACRHEPRHEPHMSPDQYPVPWARPRARAWAGVSSAAGRRPVVGWWRHEPRAPHSTARRGPPGHGGGVAAAKRRASLYPTCQCHGRRRRGVPPYQNIKYKYLLIFLIIRFIQKK